MTAPRWLPGARQIGSYERSWLRSDLVAGTSLVCAELKHPVREKLERYELIGPL
jgi:hypothetical protein